MGLFLSARPVARRALSAAIGTLIAATLATGMLAAGHASGDLAGRKVGKVALRVTTKPPIKFRPY